MRRIISLFLSVLFIIPVGCSTEKNNKAISVNLLNEYLYNINQFETAVHEFGTSLSYINMENNISVSIIYPQTGFEFLDREITNWVEGFAGEYIKKMRQKKLESAELTVLYSSYLVGESTVSIKMEGTCFSPDKENSVDIIKIFNADIKEKRFIGLKDIIRTNRFEEFQKIVAFKFGIEDSMIDEEFCKHTVITKKGIEIIIEGANNFLKNEGLEKRIVEYNEVEELLDENFDYKSDETETVSGEVTVLNDIKETLINPNKPMVALTFDDGPSANTVKLLDIFKKYGGKATFFVLGNLINGRKNTLIRIANEGHEIGNHSWNHRLLTNLTDSEIKDQIMMTRAGIYDITGKDCLIVRPPYGACNETVKAVGESLGITFVNWSVDTLDWKTKDSQSVYEEVMKAVSDGEIVLCHDLYKTTVEAMEKVVPRLIAEGYQLVTVSQLMEYSNKKIEAGKIFYRQ